MDSNDSGVNTCTCRTGKHLSVQSFCTAPIGSEEFAQNWVLNNVAQDGVKDQKIHRLELMVTKGILFIYLLYLSRIFSAVV